jgi:hypothetical protein
MFIVYYKYYVFGHYPSSCLYLKAALFIFQNTFWRLDSVYVRRRRQNSSDRTSINMIRYQATTIGDCNRQNTSVCVCV